MGAGHVPDTLVETISDLCQKIPVIATSRTGSGPVLKETYNFPGSEMDLKARGVISAGSLSGPKARILLTLLLRSGQAARVRDTFSSFE